ncbi:Chitinase [[Actinomadura] parvosata subsp. kistnae]|uniref:Glucanase n=1 Tax=[Actinomadura] parvosata subsp. kistnae TaxID=1909395 RepID=A0A1V0AD49_9ACTN|nr:cellobiohydrolase [Nonomuraea sp. ATCC 55076]SPL93520.1 Chitinase [Actinomadura parvosata subsp. kistnae]
MRLHRGLRKWAVTMTAASVAALGLVVGQTSAANAAVACDVTYTANSWTSSPGQGGFTANITLKNTGDPLTSWSLAFDYPTTGQKYTPSGWGANWSQSGTTVTGTNMSYNGSLATGASVSIGFNGTWTGTNPNPTSFKVNNTTCGGTGPTTPTVVTSSSAVAVNEGGTATFTARLSSAPSSNVTVTTARTSGDTDLTVSSGASLTFTPSNWSTPQTVTLAAAQDSDTTAGTAAFSVGGTGVTGVTVNATEVDDDATVEQSIIVSPTSVTVPEGSTGTFTARLAAQPTSSVTVTTTAGSGDSSITVSSGASLTFSTSNWNTPQTVTLAAAQDSDTTNGSRTFTVAATGLTSRTVTATEADDDGGTNPTHVENPYAGATGYVNPNWSAKAAAEPGGSAVANTSTAVWMDRIAAIAGSSSAMGLRAHLDEAVRQDAANGSAPLTIQIVIYDLPNRDCSALASNGELLISQDGFNRYKTEYIDPIAAIMRDSAYANLRIVTIIEPDSLPNLVTNINSFEKCREANGAGGYRDGVRYALNQLHAIPNVYTYIDAGHHAWLGWDSNFQPVVNLFYETVAGTTAGVDSVDGFIVNTANYGATTEPYFTINTTVPPNNTSVRQSKWVDWNWYVDEQSFAIALRNALVAKGFRSGLGMLIDTSRNGWGGSARPSGPSTATNVDDFVNQSRIDRRIHAGNWCNQSGAGMGARPTAAPASGLDAYVWIKPPGESDGASTDIPNDEGKKFDRMCDPTYTGNSLNGNNMSGAKGGAPLSGQWFSAQFRELLANAYPPIN